MQNKVVVITGASSGIGLATARYFASKSSKLVLAARNTSILYEISKELSVLNEVLVVTTDVSKEDDCKQLIEQTIARFSTIDVLINNAGISMRASFQDTDLDVLKRLMDVNFWGTVYCTKYALPYLLESKGSLVGVSSIAGYIGLPGRSGYSASKFAMHGFLRTLSAENFTKGLHVLIVAPGFTASNVRMSALMADGSIQGASPRKEDKMMSAEAVAQQMYKAIIKRKRSLILTFVEGKLTVFLSKIFPKFIEKSAYNHMKKEPNSPFS